MSVVPSPRGKGARRWAEAGALVGAGAVAAGWEAARRRDLRRIERDPAHALLADVPRGERLDLFSRDGTRLTAELFGPADAPPLVLVHGWTCARRFWTCQLHALADHYRIVTYDLRGHGDSDAPADGDFSTDALAEDLEAVLEAALPSGQRALLAGHSLGAMSIVAWAGRFPREVERRAAGVALLNTGIGDLIDESLIFKLPSGMRRAKAVAGGVFLSASGPLPPASPISLRAVQYVALSPSASPAQVAFCQEMVLQCRRDVRAGFGRTLSRLDLADALSNLTVPALVLGGMRDRLTPPPHLERMAAALPHLSECVELPRSGHMSPIEDPGSVDAALERLAVTAGLVPAAAAA
ncbi:alpha/beta fold hydrolase [Conexibacter woesei]|uniref:Alpha/beta hydrolase fold protein n=1 Tax=Conexibacter woesei (strain DSM 14684 / CCUG 47730 / CIP 108061 / JCM 11494 / NBRC 100937 / ID131577) TaxID=469383 RepID=D3FB48_CONWI|nr:alpha/beta hydrolase [Conexibacter woesei]ADB53240.1 alpha/beta hydrolase fold protein [Conexibacter woesei DSM 14684]